MMEHKVMHEEWKLNEKEIDSKSITCVTIERWTLSGDYCCSVVAVVCVVVVFIIRIRQSASCQVLFYINLILLHTQTYSYIYLATRKLTFQYVYAKGLNRKKTHK